jgi:hypothetical protein
MLRDASIIELMGSIGEKGYFPGEPILVVEDKSKEGSYRVVEGNRRLCAVKLLLNPDIAQIRRKSVHEASASSSQKPEKLPVLIFNDRSEILGYLGYRHVTGIKQWEPLAKAKYLSQFKETLITAEPSDQYRTLAKIIGSRSDYVARLLTGLALYEQIEENGFFGIMSLSADDIDFSLLTTALSYSNIVSFLGLPNSSNPSLPGLKKESLKELTEWMFERIGEGRTRLGESRHLKALNAVVIYEKALESFRSGRPLKEAELLTENPAEIFAISIMNSKSNLEMARTHVHLVERPSPVDAENLLEITKLARDLRTVIISRIELLEN